MRFVVFVTFLPDGPVSPEEFFTRINARWSWLKEEASDSLDSAISKIADISTIRTALCVTDYDSIEQLSNDLAMIYGAGIAKIEVIPENIDWTGSYSLN